MSIISGYNNQYALKTLYPNINPPNINSDNKLLSKPSPTGNRSIYSNATDISEIKKKMEKQFEPKNTIPESIKEHFENDNISSNNSLSNNEIKQIANDFSNKLELIKNKCGINFDYDKLVYTCSVLFVFFTYINVLTLGHNVNIPALKTIYSVVTIALIVSIIIHKK